MCGAFTFTQYKRIVRELGLEAGKEFMKERFNLRPTNYVPVVFNSHPHTIQLALWGITPNWGKDSKVKLLFNTRSDSLIEKPYFNRLFHTNRCIVLADGFYEWVKEGKERLPYRFTLKDDAPFAFAGIWENTGGVPQVSIITTVPNSLVAKVHNRMPVVLPLDRALDWVQNIEESKLIQMLDPYPEELMKSYRVSKDVNHSGNESPELIKEIKAA